MRRILISASVMIVLFVGVSPAQGDGDAGLLNRITTEWPIEARGAAQTHAVKGAIRIQPDVMNGVRLQAETVAVEFEWERGYEARGDDPLGRVVTEHGRKSLTFHQADIRFDRLEAAGLFLAFTEASSAHLSLVSETGLTFTGVHDRAVVKVGTPPESVRAGQTPHPGFWHRVEGPTLQATGPGKVHVEGSFTLFIHDVVVHIQADEGDWSRWTGYQEDESGPVAGFEFRLTKLFVDNGTFVTSFEQSVDHFASTFDTDLQGTVIAPGAVGRVIHAQEVLVFDEDRLVLEGSGPMVLQADETGGTDLVALSLQRSSGFTVHGASTIEPLASEALPLKAPLTLVVLAGVVSVTATMAGLARAGVVPAPTDACRERRYQRWMSRGKRLYADGRLDHAADCFGKAAHTQREAALAWYHWARTTLEAGGLETAERIAQQAAHVPGVDPLDLLDLRASAAWQRGDKEAFVRFLGQLAEGSPEMARQFVSDFEIQEAHLSPELRRALKTCRQEATIDGYA